MHVGLQDIETGQTLPGQLSATVINLSPEGACLVLPKLIFEGKHLFYATLDSDQFNLLLCPEKDGAEIANSGITAQSIWMDSCEYHDQPAFKVGIRFHKKQKELLRLLK